MTHQNFVTALLVGLLSTGIVFGQEKPTHFAEERFPTQKLGKASSGILLKICGGGVSVRFYSAPLPPPPPPDPVVRYYYAPASCVRRIIICPPNPCQKTVPNITQEQKQYYSGPKGKMPYAQEPKLTPAPTPAPKDQATPMPAVPPKQDAENFKYDGGPANPIPQPQTGNPISIQPNNHLQPYEGGPARPIPLPGGGLRRNIQRVPAGLLVTYPPERILPLPTLPYRAYGEN